LQQAALKDKVSVVHGGITSASREVIRPVLDRFKMLYFYNTQYEGGVCDRNQFDTGVTPAQTVEKLVPYAMKKLGKKVCVIIAGAVVDRNETGRQTEAALSLSASSNRPATYPQTPRLGAY
jgi:ABC-type branched-subunit amino acid transport system substrate-binding protein